jgi:hypothetical protein
VVVVIVTVCADVYVPPAGVNVGVEIAATVTTACPWIPAVAATMLALPCDFAEVRPVAFGNATVVFVEVQLTAVVRSDELESLYIPVALNCCWAPTGTVVAPGETVIDRSIGAGTLSGAEP